MQEIYEYFETLLRFFSFSSIIPINRKSIVLRSGGIFVLAFYELSCCQGMILRDVKR